jgi:hypothetical protein
MQRVATFLCLCVLSAQLPSYADVSQVERGVRLVEQGSFAEAIATLASETQRLEAGGGSRAELARAWLYTGIAYVGLGDDMRAEGAFRGALAAQPTLDVSRSMFSARVVEVFDRASAQLLPPAAVAPAHKSKRWPWVAGIGAAAADVAVAGASGGGDEPSPPPIDTRTVDDDGDGVSESQGDCDDTRAVTRRSASSSAG